MKKPNEVFVEILKWILSINIFWWIVFVLLFSEWKFDIWEEHMASTLNPSTLVVFIIGVITIISQIGVRRKWWE